MTLSLTFSGYRKLLRSISVAFKSDNYAITMAKKQLKSEFLKNALVQDTKTIQVLSLYIDVYYINKLLYRDIDEIEEMLRFNIVQGKRNKSEGNFGINFLGQYSIIFL